jgi:hypothetical protein
MSEMVNTGSMVEENLPLSKEPSLPVESYLDRFDVILKDFSSNELSFDVGALQRGPNNDDSWSEIEHYVSCIRIPGEQSKSIHLPYWGNVELPDPEEVAANPDPEKFTPEEVLGRLFLVNAALGVNFDYYNKDSSKVESTTLGKLIGDIYPGLEGGIKDIKKELELAFRNPDRFKKKYTQDSSSKETLTRKAFIRKGALLSTAVLFVLIADTVASCSSDPVPADPVPIDRTSIPTLNNDPNIVVTEDYTSTPESTPTPTSIPTEAPTPTATLPPLIEGGDIENITENMEEGDLLWSILELQEIVNGYNRSSSRSFSEYINEVRESLPDEDKYDGLSKVLIKLEEFDQMSTMSLIYSLKDSFPELSIIDIPEGFDSIIEALPEDLREKMVEFGDNVKKGTNQSHLFQRIYDGRAIIAPAFQYELGDIYPGIIIMDGIESVDAPPKLTSVIIVVGQIEKNGVVYSVGLMLNEQKRLVISILSDEKASEIFRNNYEIILVSDFVLSAHSTN